MLSTCLSVCQLMFSFTSQWMFFSSTAHYILISLPSLASSPPMSNDAELFSFSQEIEALHVVFNRIIALLMVKLIYQGTREVKAWKRQLLL